MILKRAESASDYGMSGKVRRTEGNKLINLGEHGEGSSQCEKNQPR